MQFTNKTFFLMPALTKAELIAKLTELGVAATEDMKVDELRALLKEAQGSEDGEEQKGDAGSAEQGETVTMLVNVMHDGVLYQQGSEVVLRADVQELFKQKGFIA